MKKIFFSKVALSASSLEWVLWPALRYLCGFLICSSNWFLWQRGPQFNNKIVKLHKVYYSLHSSLFYITKTSNLFIGGGARFDRKHYKININVYVTVTVDVNVNINLKVNANENKYFLFISVYFRKATFTSMNLDNCDAPFYNQKLLNSKKVFSLNNVLYHMNNVVFWLFYPALWSLKQKFTIKMFL